MKRLLILAATILVFASMASAQHAAIDSLMTRFNRTDAPGGAITVVQHGEIAFQSGYGMASLEQGTAIRPETIFDIGSVAKQFTGFALAVLDHRGLLSLDDAVRTHLPEIPDFGHSITIRHLLNHTSGLREVYDAKSLSGWIGGDRIEQEEALRLTRHMHELNFEPGTEYLYCNTAYMLLADVVARVTGQSFPEWMQEHVFDPLKMETAEIMDVPGEVIPGSADSYAPARGGGFVRTFDNSSAFGQGGIYASGKDMARWLANFGSMRVGGPEVFDRLTTRGILASGDTLVYALGISIREHRGAGVWLHTGASAGFRSVLAWFPAFETGFFVQGNRADFNAVSVLWDVVDAVLGGQLAPQSPETESPGTPDEDAAPPAFDAEEYEGRYFSPELESVFAVVRMGDSLVLTHRRRGDMPMRVLEEDVFQAEGFGTLRFERDDAGAVTGYRVTTGRVRALRFSRFD